jgi:hypothetical protein
MDPRSSSGAWEARTVERETVSSEDFEEARNETPQGCQEADTASGMNLEFQRPQRA